MVPVASSTMVAVASSTTVVRERSFGSFVWRWRAAERVGGGARALVAVVFRSWRAEEVVCVGGGTEVLVAAFFRFRWRAEVRVGVGGNVAHAVVVSPCLRGRGILVNGTVGEVIDNG